MSEWVGRSGMMALGGIWKVVNMITLVWSSQTTNKNEKKIRLLSFYAGLWQSFTYYRFYFLLNIFLTICTFLSVLLWYSLRDRRSWQECGFIHPVWKTYVLSKVKCMSVLWPSNSTPSYIIKINKSMWVKHAFKYAKRHIQECSD